MSSLDDFFAQMRPFLLGETSVEQLEATLGASASGRDNLQFYRTLIQRNFDKFLREMYPTVFRVAQQVRAEFWAELVEEYAKGRHPRSHDPNEFSQDFSDFLVGRRERDPTQPEIMEQLADFQWLRHAVNVAPDLDGDGFDQRLFLRHYSHPVPAFYVAIFANPAAPLPEPADTLAVIYRSTHTLEPSFTTIGGPELAALARRQGHPLPGLLAELAPEAIDAAQRLLEKRGVLVRSS